MTLEESLDLVVARTRHERYRWLCSEDNPDEWQREGYRRIVLQMATSEPSAPVEYPSLATQAGSLVGAAVRFAASGFATVSQEEHDRRRGICEQCENLDVAAQRCRVCGCALSLKPWSKAESCPLNPPRW